MENKSKVHTFVGFAMRTGRFKIGVNAVSTLKKAYLVLVCGSASENTKKESEKLAKRFYCPLLETLDGTLSDMTYRDNAKVMAITDKDLAKAIIDNAGNNFIARI